MRSGTEPLRESLNAENWTVTKAGSGAGLLLRFTGRAPASFDDLTIKEPTQASVEATAESTAMAYVWAQAFDKVRHTTRTGLYVCATSREIQQELV